MRIVLFTGKGGVGKTTIAAATALRVAATGRKTLIMSTDPAHSVADALGEDVGPDASEVAPGLWAEQIDPQRRLEDNWRDIQQHAMAVLNWAGLEEIEAEELSVVPGLDELFSLADVKQRHDEGPYDVVVVDCAPTGETMRLLSLPDILQWYMERIFPVERRVVGALRPVAQRVTSFPLPDEGVYRAVKRFYDKLDGVRHVLTDPRTTSIRLVVNAESMVIAEARRMFTYFNLFGYRVDAVIANRLLPEAVTDPYFDQWKQLQSRHLASIQESFDPVPVLRANLRDREPIGADLLRDLGDEVYAGSDPFRVLHEEQPMSITRRDDSYVLSLKLSLARREELEVSTRGDELYVKVGPYRRTIMLPKVLASRGIVSARLREEQLEIEFSRSATRNE
jgi:arsenite-transporting ATPase